MGAGSRVNGAGVDRSAESSPAIRGSAGPVEFRSANDGDNGDGRPLIALIIVELAAMRLLIAVGSAMAVPVPTS